MSCTRFESADRIVLFPLISHDKDVPGLNLAVNVFDVAACDRTGEERYAIIHLEPECHGVPRH